jgi:Ca2+-binding RTX toxin-like protein
LTTAPILGPRFDISPDGSPSPADPSFAALADGRIVSLWKDNNGLHLRIIAPDGTTTRVTTDIPGSFAHPSIAAGSNGGFIVAWTTFLGADGDQEGIGAQAFDSAGIARGPAFTVNTETASLQREPGIAALDDGGFVITWYDGSGIGGDTSATGIKAQRVSSLGTPEGPEFLVNTAITDGTQQGQVAAGLQGGGFVVAWTSNSTQGPDTSGAAVYARFYDKNGIADTVEIPVNTATPNDQRKPQITVLATGQIVIMWEDSSVPAEETNIRGQVLNPDGSRSGAEFAVATGNFDQSTGVVTGLADGRFAVLSSDNTDNGSGNVLNVTLRLFNGDGSASGLPVILNQERGFFIPTPALSLLADGRLIASWTDDNRLVARVIDPRAEGVDLNGTLADDRFAGTAFADRISGSAGQDSLDGGDADDRISGEDGNDSLAGDAGNDRIFGGAGSDRLQGGAGSDVLDGESGDDALDGGQGGDLMRGGAGNDVYRIDADGDRAVEAAGAGRDRIESGTLLISLYRFAGVEDVTLLGEQDLTAVGNAGGNRLTGNGGANTLFGEAGRDRLAGGGGSDTLNGGRDADRLTGGDGADRLSGGCGADDFRFRSAAEAQGDRIVDFRAGTDDIDLRGFMSSGEFIGRKAFTGEAGDVRYVARTGILSGDVDGDGVADWSLTIENKALLTAADFIF